MRPLAGIEAALDALEARGPRPADAAELLTRGEEVLEHWVRARGEEPTADRREGISAFNQKRTPQFQGE